MLLLLFVARVATHRRRPVLVGAALIGTTVRGTIAPLPSRPTTTLSAGRRPIHQRAPLRPQRGGHERNGDGGGDGKGLGGSPAKDCPRGHKRKDGQPSRRVAGKRQAPDHLLKSLSL